MYTIYLSLCTQSVDAIFEVRAISKAFFVSDVEYILLDIKNYRIEPPAENICIGGRYC